MKEDTMDKEEAIKALCGKIPDGYYGKLIPLSYAKHIVSLIHIKTDMYIPLTPKKALEKLKKTRAKAKGLSKVKKEMFT